MQPLRSLILILALTQIPSVGFSQSLDVAALVETQVRDVLVPAGYYAEEAPQPDRSYGPGYGAAVSESPLATLEEALKDAASAPIARRRSANSRDDSNSLYNWNFRSKREQELKTLELEIRMQLVRDNPKRWRLPGFIRHYSDTRPVQENEIIQLRSGGPHAELTFEERISDDCVHAYMNHVRRDNQRVSFHGVPKAVWDAVQLGRPVTFLAIVHGTESYQSVSGERTIASAYYVDEQLFASLVKKYTPAAQEATPPRPKSRTWTSSDGKYKIEGYAQSASAKSVSIMKSDGKAIEVDLAKLSSDDADWVKAYQAALRPLQLPPENRSYGIGDAP